MEIPIFRSDKILSHIDRVYDWLEGKNPPPITVELDLTNRCNNNCPKCIGFRQPVVDLQNPKKIIKEIVQFGVRGITFSGGGEPLLHPELTDCVKYTSGLGADVAVISNGLAMTKSIAWKIKPYCTWIRISLDAFKPETHERVHGVKGVLETVKANIKSLAKSVGKATIGVGFLVSKEVLDEMLPATEFCKEAGVDYIQFRPFHYDFTPIDKELKKCLKLQTDKFKVLYSKAKYDCMKDGSFQRDYTICYGQQFASVITATGKVYLCCHFRANPKYCLGDLNRQSFAEIWNSRRRFQVIKNINLKECVPLCRCDSFNQILFSIKAKKEHINFL